TPATVLCERAWGERVGGLVVLGRRIDGCLDLVFRVEEPGGEEPAAETDRRERDDEPLVPAERRADAREVQAAALRGRGRRGDGRVRGGIVALHGVPIRVGRDRQRRVRAGREEGRLVRGHQSWLRPSSGW